jgi:hypothetical protein
MPRLVVVMSKPSRLLINLSSRATKLFLAV